MTAGNTLIGPLPLAQQSPHRLRSVRNVLTAVRAMHAALQAVVRRWPSRVFACRHGLAGVCSQQRFVRQQPSYPALPTTDEQTTITSDGLFQAERMDIDGITLSQTAAVTGDNTYLRLSEFTALSQRCCQR